MKKKVVALFAALLVAANASGLVCAEEISEDIVVTEKQGMGTQAEMYSTKIPACEALIIEGTDEGSIDLVIQEEETDGADADGRDAAGISILSITEVEKAPSALLEAGTEGQEEYQEEISGEVSRSFYASDAAASHLRLLAGGFAGASYGSQLEAEAKEVYDVLVSTYVMGKSTGAVTITFSSPVTFQVEATRNESGGLEWNKPENVEYQQNVCYPLQAAYDAFMYDYPQIYWMTNFSYSMTIRMTGGLGSYTGSVSQIQVRPVEGYTGAAAEQADFSDSVDQAVSEISLPSGASRWETVKAIHDYLCRKLTYGIPEGGSVYAHTTAGVFLKDGIVVCEGYAKAFKLLCDRFNLDCMLIVGNAGGGHMWNYVRMEDDNWYLVDVTWDDQSSGTIYNFFLKGGNSIGKTEKLSQERTVYMNFSGAVYTRQFAVPVLNPDAYNREEVDHTHDWKVTEEKQPTCQDTGYSISACTICREESKIILDKVQHSFSGDTYIENNDASCTKDGTRTVVCDYGCGQAGGTQVMPGTMKAHSYNNYVSNNDATFQKDGTKTSACKYGCGKKKTITDSGSKVTLSVASLKLRIGQSSSAVKVVGLPSGMKVTKWKSSDTSIAKVSSSGKITAKKKTGSTWITVTISNGTVTDTKKIKVRVYAVKTTSVSVKTTSLTLKKGKKKTLSVVVKPSDSTQEVTYSSADKKVASVTAKGVVAAKKAGTTKITVKSGSKKATVTIKVPKTKTEKITNLKSVITMKAGKTKALKPKLYPTDSDEKITYKSSNKKVAAVSSKGKITAKKKGTTTVTVSSGSVSVKIRVKVK